MVDRTFELLVSQLEIFIAGIPQDMTGLAQWAIKVSKSYKALRVMEVHKTAEPKLARTLKSLYPHLENLKGLFTVEENDSLEDPSMQQVMMMSGEDGIILQGGYGIDEASAVTSHKSQRNQQQEHVIHKQIDAMDSSMKKKGIELTMAAKAQLGTTALRESMEL